MFFSGLVALLLLSVARGQTDSIEAGSSQEIPLPPTGEVHETPAVPQTKEAESESEKNEKKSEKLDDTLPPQGYANLRVVPAAGTAPVDTLHLHIEGPEDQEFVLPRDELFELTLTLPVGRYQARLVSGDTTLASSRADVLADLSVTLLDLDLNTYLRHFAIVSDSELALELEYKGNRVEIPEVAPKASDFNVELTLPTELHSQIGTTVYLFRYDFAILPVPGLVLHLQPGWEVSLDETSVKAISTNKRHVRLVLLDSADPAYQNFWQSQMPGHVPAWDPSETLGTVEAWSAPGPQLSVPGARAEPPPAEELIEALYATGLLELPGDEYLYLWPLDEAPRPGERRLLAATTEITLGQLSAVMGHLPVEVIAAYREAGLVSEHAEAELLERFARHPAAFVNHEEAEQFARRLEMLLHSRGLEQLYVMLPNQRQWDHLQNVSPAAHATPLPVADLAYWEAITPAGSPADGFQGVHDGLWEWLRTNGSPLRQVGGGSFLRPNAAEPSELAPTARLGNVGFRIIVSFPPAPTP